MICLIPFFNLQTHKVNLDVLLSTVFSHQFARCKGTHQCVRIKQPRSVGTNTQIREEREKLEGSLSALGAHEEKQAGNCITHLFCLGDREAIYEITEYLWCRGWSGPQLNSAAVFGLLSTAQIPHSYRKPYSDTVAGGKEHKDDGEAADVSRGVIYCT